MPSMVIEEKPYNSKNWTLKITSQVIGSLALYKIVLQPSFLGCGG